MQIAIANAKTPARVDVIATVTGMNSYGAIRFFADNGAWYGSILGNVLTVEDTDEQHNAIIIWQGSTPYPSWKYNENIEWVNTQINVAGARIRDYIYVCSGDFKEIEETTAITDDDWDDVPF